MKGLNHLCFADIIMVGSYKHYGKDELQGQWLCWFSEHVYNHFRLQQGYSLVQE